MLDRGWTDDMINDAMQTDGIPTEGNFGPATRYIHPATGQSLVIDNLTREIFHVGGPGYLY
jgi:hypothetical protein